MSSRLARFTCSLLTAVSLVLAGARPALAQVTPRPTREAIFEWDLSRRFLFVSVSYRDVIDAKIRNKLSRGLPTTIVMTAGVYREGNPEPVAATAQTCRITWLLWETIYRVEVTRPGYSKTELTAEVGGVLRRCVEARRLLAADHQQLPLGAKVYLKGSVRVNPVSPEIRNKIKRWVSRPTATGTAAPGDALFSTFTSLFLKPIGDAERELDFVTRPVLPRVYPIQKEKK